MVMADPEQALIEAIRTIGREHRPASMSVLLESMTCACGVESSEPDGLERHRAELILAAVDADRASIQAETLRKAAEDLPPFRDIVRRDHVHRWLRDRAARIEEPTP
jgi:hypothetical protein